MDEVMEVGVNILIFGLGWKQPEFPRMVTDFRSALGLRKLEQTGCGGRSSQNLQESLIVEEFTFLLGSQNTANKLAH